MSYRENLIHIPSATIRRGFLAALATRNGFFGSGDLFTMGQAGAGFAARLQDAQRLEITVDSPGGRPLTRSPASTRPWSTAAYSTPLPTVPIG